MRERQVSAFCKNLVRKMDSDGNGELSGRELYNALHHPELGLRDIAARLVVKHDSEWYGGSGHHRWNVYFSHYDSLRIDYAKQWLDDCEWMSKVEAFKDGKPVWHFHPVMFLHAINGIRYPNTPVNGSLVSLEFINFYNGEVIDDADFELAAEKLKCEIAAIKAVAQTETGNSGSYFKFEKSDDFVPAMLFEKHLFHKLTKGKFDAQSDISDKKSGGYGKIQHNTQNYYGHMHLINVQHSCQLHGVNFRCWRIIIKQRVIYLRKSLLSQSQNQKKTNSLHS